MSLNWEQPEQRESSPRDMQMGKELLNAALYLMLLYALWSLNAKFH